MPAHRPGRRTGGGRAHMPRWFLRALAVIFLMQVAVNAIRPTVSYRALDLGAHGGQIGLIAAAFAVLSLMCAIPAGRLIDRHGETPFIIVGQLLVAGVALALLAVTSVWGLVLATALLGLGQVLTTVGMQALIANSDSEGRDGRFGAFTVIVSSGQLVGPALGGFVNEHLAVPRSLQPFDSMDLAGTAVFVLATLTGFLGVALAVANRRAGMRGQSHDGGAAAPVSVVRGVGMVLRQPNAPHAMLASIAVLTTVDLLVAYLPVYGEEHGLSTAVVGYLLAARAASSMFSRLLMQRLIALVGRGGLLVLSTLVPAVVLAPLALIDQVALVAVVMVVAGFGLGLGQPLSLIWITETAPARMRGTAVGVRMTGNRLGQVAIPAVVAGAVTSSGVGAVFVMTGLMLALSSAVTMRGSFEPPAPIADRSG